MAMNAEFEHHIEASKENEAAVKALESLRNLFNGLVEAGVINELPRRITLNNELSVSPQTAVVETKKKVGIEVRCGSCEYDWTYKGKLGLASCPNCSRKVKVPKLAD